MSTDATPGRGWSWPQLAALVVGALYLVIGVVGFAVIGFDEDFFAHDTGETLLGFEINNAHNTVHVIIGVAGLALVRTLAAARVYGWLLAVGYGAAFVYGLFAVGETWDVLSLNWADNWLHLVSAVIGLAIAVGPVRAAVSRRSTTV